MARFSGTLPRRGKGGKDGGGAEIEEGVGGVGGVGGIGGVRGVRARTTFRARFFAKWNLILVRMATYSIIAGLFVHPGERGERKKGSSILNLNIGICNMGYVIWDM